MKFLFSEDIVSKMTIDEAIRTLTLEYEMNDSSDIYSFYINMERLLILYDVKENKPYYVPLQDGGYLSFSLSKNGCVLSEHFFDGHEQVYIDENTLALHEKSVLILLTQALSSHIEIGHRYPQKMVNLLKDIQKNDFFSFSDGQSFLCVNKKDGFILLQPTCKNKDISTITLKDFLKEYKPFELAYENPIALQEFYNHVKNRITGSVILHIVRDGKVLYQKEIIKTETMQEVLSHYKEPLRIRTDIAESIASELTKDIPIHPFETNDISALSEDIASLLNAFEETDYGK